MYPFILFLDFDGVLHRRTSGTCRHLPALERILRRHPKVKVVISSSWRLQLSLEELRGWFSPDIQARVIGSTPELHDGHGSRQREIEYWLHANPTEYWVALDDEPNLFNTPCHWLLLTDSSTGLTAEDLEQLEARISEVS